MLKVALKHTVDRLTHDYLKRFIVFQWNYQLWHQHSEVSYLLCVCEWIFRVLLILS